MKKQIYKIDEDGCILFGEEITIDTQEEVPLGYIDVPLPTDNKEEQLPFYRPKWTGTEWIEDMTQEEIDELNNQPVEPRTEELQIEYNIDLDYRLSLIEMGLV